MPNGGGRVTFTSPSVRFDSVETLHWGELCYSVVPGKPQDLHIVRDIDPPTAKSPSTLRFDLTYLSRLAPLVSPEPPHTVDQSFTPQQGLQMRFHVDWIAHDAPEGERRSMRQLRCTCQADVDIGDVAQIKSAVVGPMDDLLSVMSLAERHRASWLRWSASGPNKSTQFFRGFFSPPEDEPSQHREEDRLIDRNHFAPFVQFAVARLRASTYKPQLIGAIHALTGGRKTLESHYLTLFAAFEELTLAFRRTNDLEFVLDSKSQEWKRLCKAVKRVVKDESGLEKSQRELIYDKLPELNRISLRTAVDRFVSEFGIPISDLWPVSGNSGLSGVRNLLIHGGFPEDMLSELWCAKEHVSMLLERCVLRLLAWDLELSRVSPEYLGRSDLMAMSEMEKSREAVRQACE